MTKIKFSLKDFIRKFWVVSACFSVILICSLTAIVLGSSESSVLIFAFVVSLIAPALIYSLSGSQTERDSVNNFIIANRRYQIVVNKWIVESTSMHDSSRKTVFRAHSLGTSFGGELGSAVFVAIADQSEYSKALEKAHVG